MSEPHDQRTFIPDDDSAERANWPVPRPRRRERAALIEWVPGAICLIACLVGVFALMLD